MVSTYDTHPAEVPDWNNLKVLHKHTLPPRAYFHNYVSEADALAGDVSKSSTHSLSGTWKFQLAHSPFEAPEGFEEPSFDTSSWRDIVVPGMWQLQGFGRGPQYTNVQYPIPVDPPNVPFTDNETGSYLRTFTVPDGLQGQQIRLRFEGVDSSFHVWLNGKEVGYSQGSRNPDEFDITDFVKKNGENTLTVRVYQWCDGSYIEDQDQWWLSGIFRDVSLVGFPLQSRIDDISVQTVLDSSYRDAELKIKLDVTDESRPNIKLLDAEMKEVELNSTKDDSEGRSVMTISSTVRDPKKWSAETPYLYHLVVSYGEQYISFRVGFRQVEVKDGLLKVNGKRIVFRGVNRHEHHPEHGRAVPFEFMKEDLRIMKGHNINAIRTSHQPNDPRLYDLADEMGFWLIDEADLECHGFEIIEDAVLQTEDWYRALPRHQRELTSRDEAAKWTSDNPEWTDAYVDRAEHLVKRDQLHPSVIIWSLGNEAFFGRNHKAMYKWIKEHDDSRPVHYEADVNAEAADVYSQMYSSVDDIIEFAKDESKTKPLILCEFIHAMGNGPGNIKEYIDAFYRYPMLQGGFVWEWANHGLLKRDENTGEEFYAYGGDFGETVHDSTFVMDGILNSDHSPNPALIEYKKAIEPVQLLGSEKTKAKFINRYDLVTLDHLECHCSAYLFAHETTTFSGFYSIDIPSGVGPGTEFELDLPELPEVDGEMLLNLSFRLKDGTSWLATGFEVATAQIPVNKISYLRQLPSSAQALKIITSKPGMLEIESTEWVWNFNTIYGHLTSWVRNGTELISKPPELNFYRAQTDNDIPQDGQDWTNRLLHLSTPSTRKVSWSQTAGHTLTITVQQRIAPPVLSWSIDCTLTYTFNSNGSLGIHVSGTPQGKNLPRTLPRIGLVVELPKHFQRVTWFGRGPGESYRDSKLSQPMGKHSVASVDALWTAYEVPQESSNRTDTRWLKLASASTFSAAPPALVVQFVGEQSGSRGTFDFQASHYRMADVAEARHPYELRTKKTEDVVLRLDAQHHGLGTGSCGPKTLEEYALHTEPFAFEMLLQYE